MPDDVWFGSMKLQFPKSTETQKAHPMPDEHKEIWLQPWCADCAMHEDRTWCQDNVWEDGCEQCGAKPVKYVLAIQKDASNAGNTRLAGPPETHL